MYFYVSIISSNDARSLLICLIGTPHHIVLMGYDYPVSYILSVPPEESELVVVVADDVLTVLTVVNVVTKSLHVSQHLSGYVRHIDSVATQFEKLSP